MKIFDDIRNFFIASIPFLLSFVDKFTAVLQLIFVSLSVGIALIRFSKELKTRKKIKHDE